MRCPLAGTRIRITHALHRRAGREAVIRSFYHEAVPAYWARLGSGLETVVRPWDFEVLA